MFASPFFTSGRAAILPRIASKDELHTANSLTQTTQWTTTTIGTLLGGFSAAHFGYTAAFVINSLSFVFSAWAISRLRLPDAEPRPAAAMTEADVMRPFREYAEGLRYLRGQPLMLAIALVGVGWASGGGAAQILFSLFGELVFNRGPAGIGILWGAAGFGLIVGGALAHKLGPRLTFSGYKRTIAICYLVHGGSYVLFSQAANFYVALVWIGISRGAVAVSSVLNWSLLLRHVDDAYRGPRVRDERVADLGDDDGVDDGRRDRLAKRRSALDRRRRRHRQLADGRLLDMGRSRRPARAAGHPAPRSGRRGGPHRSARVIGQQ